MFKLPTQEKPKAKLWHNKAEKQSKRDHEKELRKEYMDLARTKKNAGTNFTKFTLNSLGTSGCPTIDDLISPDTVHFPSPESRTWPDKLRIWKIIKIIPAWPYLKIAKKLIVICLLTLQI